MKTKAILLTLCLLAANSAPIQAKYLPAKCLGALTTFLVAMPFANELRIAYCRNQAIHLSAKTSLACGTSDFHYWLEREKTFRERARSVESAFDKIHNFFGVNVNAIDGGIFQYGLKAIQTGGLALAAAGIEYGIRNS